MQFWTPGMSLEEVEKQVIQRAFSHFQRNKTATSSSLGISIRTLDSKLEKYEKDLADESDRIAAAREAAIQTLARQRGQAPSDGIRVESDSAASEEFALSLSKREEIQKVLPEQTTDLRAKKRS